ncbi:1-aminocyclopropane-1-carboxylate synthase [Lasiodiplodia theobromae]|uniref:1-aminocyclopropane-1-carboxylate synthase n=1 Tax=Lasiodiplodia theobromae TaxID=45133 RepID=A0A8H7M9Z2_9PEZI|nr:1-aminocyclopropane-1-carboxylate synthase [Lasiodiplodia theobromae]KAF4541767.1 1-aminocyclopropane-1-carboxylate synthase [Lasiodiplodia theobromae]KAF9629780.1 1-aminocyclopropane-1-carboxylate synthase [Lasiodiplodia theobromae]
MVNLEPFGVEEWMDAHENSAKYNLAETCCASISIEDLQALAEDPSEKSVSILTTSEKLTYGAIRGSEALRKNLSNLYSSRATSRLPEDNILITPGAIMANTLVFYALVGPGDHVIVHHPTYQQLYEVPKSLGAEVDLWEAKAEKDWVPDLEELKALVRPNTKLIVVNNPNNPTGAILPKSLLQDLIDFAATKSITILSDEVYRPIFHSISPIDDAFPPSILSLGYEHTIATGSLSKAYSLAGIRVGWIASRSAALVEKMAAARHYTTISVSSLDQQVAARALSPSTVHALLARNIGLAKANLEILEKFVTKHDDVVDWVKPKAGTTAFLRFHREGEGGEPVDAAKFCKTLLDETGVLFVPGPESFGQRFPGYVRVGFCCETDVLKEGLEKVRLWMKKNYDDVPVVVA